MSTPRSRISAAELNIGEAHFAPAAIDATLAGGVLKARFPNLGAYGGQANGDVIVDASAATRPMRCAAISPACARCRCCGARPISTSSTASCRRRSRCARTATSQRAIMSNLDGTVFAIFPGRRHPRPQRRADDPLADVEHAVGMAGGQGADHRSHPASAPRSGSRRARPPPPISIWSARWCG